MDRPDLVWRGKAMNVSVLTDEQKFNIAMAANLSANWYESYAICRLDEGKFVTVDILINGECYYLIPVAEAGE